MRPSVANQSTVVKNLLQDIQLAEKLHREDRLGEAYFLLKNIEEFTRNLDEESQGKVNSVMEKSVIIPDIHSEGNKMIALLRSFHDDNVWNTWNKNLGSNLDGALYIHRDEPEGQFFFKAEGYVHDCNMTEVVAALLENDLYKSWFPLCTSSECLSTLSAYRRIIRSELDFVLFNKKCVSNV